MSVDFLLETWRTHKNDDAIIWNDQSYSYGWLLDRLVFGKRKLLSNKLHAVPLLYRRRLFA